MQPSPQPPPQPKPLDDLIANVEHYVDYGMRNSARVTRWLFVRRPGGAWDPG